MLDATQQPSTIAQGAKIAISTNKVYIPIDLSEVPATQQLSTAAPQAKIAISTSEAYAPINLGEVPATYANSLDSNDIDTDASKLDQQPYLASLDPLLSSYAL